MVLVEVERWNKLVEIEVCCEEMGKAVQRGSDAEGWGELVNSFSLDQGFFFVGGTSLARYCPWCGRDTIE